MRKRQLGAASQRGKEPLSTAEDTVRIRYQATTSEDIGNLVCALATALQFFVVTSFKSPINPITNPNPVSNRDNTSIVNMVFNIQVP
jgi:hypothetical protein